MGCSRACTGNRGRSERGFVERNFPSLWEGLCVWFRVGRVFRKSLPLQACERRSEDFFMDSMMRMGSTPGMVAENKLTCALEFPILKCGGQALGHRIIVTLSLPAKCGLSYSFDMVENSVRQ